MAKIPLSYWMHANMLTLNGAKMSKSTGNTLMPNELFTGDNEVLSKAFSPAVVRFFYDASALSKRIRFL